MSLTLPAPDKLGAGKILYRNFIFNDPCKFPHSLAVQCFRDYHIIYVAVERF